MQLALVTAISLHIVAATFWAGSTFALARMAGNGSQQLFGPQLISAVLAMGAGGYLWHSLHEGSFGTAEQLLAVGAFSAVIAFAIQVVVIGRALRTLSRSADDTRARSQIATAYRATALLLAIAAVAMASSRYA
jgi:hypothetical protein